MFCVHLIILWLGSFSLWGANPYFSRENADLSSFFNAYGKKLHKADQKTISTEFKCLLEDPTFQDTHVVWIFLAACLKSGTQEGADIYDHVVNSYQQTPQRLAQLTGYTWGGRSMNEGESSIYQWGKSLEAYNGWKSERMWNDVVYYSWNDRFSHNYSIQNYYFFAQLKGLNIWDMEPIHSLYHCSGINWWWWSLKKDQQPQSQRMASKGRDAVDDLLPSSRRLFDCMKQEGVTRGKMQQAVAVRGQQSREITNPHAVDPGDLDGIQGTILFVGAMPHEDSIKNDRSSLLSKPNLYFLDARGQPSDKVFVCNFNEPGKVNECLLGHTFDTIVLDASVAKFFDTIPGGKGMQCLGFLSLMRHLKDGGHCVMQDLYIGNSMLPSSPNQLPDEIKARVLADNPTMQKHEDFRLPHSIWCEFKNRETRDFLKRNKLESCLTTHELAGFSEFRHPSWCDSTLLYITRPAGWKSVLDPK